MSVDIIDAGLRFSSSIIPINCDVILIESETREGSYAFRNKIESRSFNNFSD